MYTCSGVRKRMHLRIIRLGGESEQIPLNKLITFLRNREDDNSSENFRKLNNVSEPFGGPEQRYKKAEEGV